MKKKEAYISEGNLSVKLTQGWKRKKGAPRLGTPGKGQMILCEKEVEE